MSYEGFYAFENTYRDFSAKPLILHVLCIFSKNGAKENKKVLFSTKKHHAKEKKLYMTKNVQKPLTTP